MNLFAFFLVLSFIFYRIVPNDFLLTLSLFALIVTALYHILFSKTKYSHTTLARIDKMEGVEFENCVAEFFKSKGFKASLTPGSGDFGADVVVTKKGIKTIIQCKRYKAKVGVSAVQEIVSAKAYYRADALMVITNSKFTDAAVKLAQVNKVKLCDREWCKNNLCK